VGLHKNWSSPYFYFRFSRPTDLESASQVSPLAMKVSTKFNVDTTIRCLVIELLLLIRYVTLWPWHLTFWPWSVGGHVVNPSTKFEHPYSYPFLSHEFWHLPYRIPLTVRLQPLRMSISRDLRVGGKFFPHIWNPWTRFAYSLYSFYGAAIKINKVIRQNSL